jgi:hypothetical protein
MSQRNPLGDISGNARGRKELTPYQRAKICESREQGLRWSAISKKFKIDPKTARKTVELETTRPDGVSLLRSGRPTLITARQERIILRKVRLEPKIKFEDLVGKVEATFSRSTLTRILSEHHLKHWVCKKRPYLTPEHVSTRLKWSKSRLKEQEDWLQNIIFSDEMSAERGSGKRQQWCWRSVSEKWDKSMIQTYTKGKDISIMVWGAIWIGGRSDLYIMSRDEESKKGGYSSKSYIEVLENQLLTIYQPGIRFM